MDAGGFGELRAALHRRPSTALYHHICTLLVAQGEDAAQLDYARAIMDRSWPDALRVATRCGPNAEEALVEAALARAWRLDLESCLARLERLPCPPALVVTAAARRWYRYELMCAAPLLHRLRWLEQRPDHLDLSALPLDPDQLPALIDALPQLGALTLDADALDADELRALLYALSPDHRLTLHLPPRRLATLSDSAPPARCPALDLVITIDYDHEPDLEPLERVAARWPLRALRTSCTLDDAALLALIQRPALRELAACWAPGAQQAEVLASLGLRLGSLRASLDAEATDFLLAQAASGALPCGSHAFTLRFLDRYDDELFDRLQRRYPPGALTCASDTRSPRWRSYDEGDWYAYRRGLSEPPAEAAFARTQRAPRGASLAHLSDALDDYTSHRR